MCFANFNKKNPPRCPEADKTKNKMQKISVSHYTNFLNVSAKPAHPNSARCALP